MTQPNGQRLLVLRELEGITQGQLADRLGVSQPTISSIEKAQRALPDDVLHKARVEFGLPRSFFFVGPFHLDVALPTFKKSSRARATDERRIVRHYREAARCFAEASLASGYHESMVPLDLETLDIEDAATEIRRLADIGNTEPIKNMTRLLERLGIGVVNDLDPRTDEPEPKHFGISVPATHNNRPLIALAATMPGAVMRFALAHELGHHIWDRRSGGTWRSTRAPEEKRAHAFAGALLLPRNVVQSHVTESLHLNGYLVLKSRYGVSVGACIMRAQQLGRISPERARSLHIQLTARGWRREEPVEVAAERPLLFAQALGRITDLSRPRIEEATGLPSDLVFHWLNIEAPTATIIDMQSRRRRMNA